MALDIHYQAFYGSAIQPVRPAPGQAQATRQSVESLMNLLRDAGGQDFHVHQDGRGWVFHEGRGWF